MAEVVKLSKTILRVLYQNNIISINNININIIIIIFSATGELGDGDVCDLPPRRI